jgi:hypothetical protein
VGKGGDSRITAHVGFSDDGASNFLIVDVSALP